MKFRGTWIALILVTALVAFAIYDQKSGEKKAQISEEQKNLSIIPPSDITKFSIETNARTISAEKAGTKWMLLSPVKDEGDQQAIENFLESAATEKQIQVVAEGKEFDPKVYGLNTPVATFKFLTATGREVDIKIGRVKAYDNSLYAQINNDPKALLVSSIWDNHIAKTDLDFRSKYVFRKNFELAQVSKFSITKNSQKQDFVKDGESYRVVKGAPDFPLQPSKVKEFFDQIEALRAQALLVGPKKLDGKPDLEIELQTDDKKFSLSAVEVPSVKGIEPTFRLLSSDVDAPISVTLAAFNTINRDAQDFYDRSRPFKFDVTKVSEVQALGSQRRIKFVKQGDKWALVEGSLQAPFDPSKLSDAINKTSKLEPVRILESLKVGQKPPKLEDARRLVFSNSKGDEVFSFEWGKALVEKGKHLEIRYVPARTSSSAHRLALPEKSLHDLGFDNLF